VTSLLPLQDSDHRPPEPSGGEAGESRLRNRAMKFCRRSISIKNYFVNKIVKPEKFAILDLQLLKLVHNNFSLSVKGYKS
jgi:hypothetical protein